MSLRTPNHRALIFGNWKLYLGVADSCELAQKLQPLAAKLEKVKISIIPSAPCLSKVKEATLGSTIEVGAQNVCSIAKGAFTGENSVSQLKELGVSFALVGHSERRHIFHESIAETCARALGALSQNLPVIFCVGETDGERARGETSKVLEDQLEGFQIPEGSEDKVIIAYEPVWAIGTGKVARVSEIQDTHRTIATILEKSHKISPPIIYGGSVDQKNIASIVTLPEVSGVLVGRASTDLSSFESLILEAERNL